MAEQKYDYEKLGVLLNAMQSLDNAMSLLTSSCTPILAVEGVVGNKCSTARIALLKSAAVDARETFLLEFSAAAQRYRDAVERELNRTLSR